MGTRKYNWANIFQQAAEMVEAGEEDSIDGLARELDVPRSTFRDALDRDLGINASNLDDLSEAIENFAPGVGSTPSPQVEEVYKFAEDGSRTIERVIELSEGDMQDPVVIMEKMGLDPLKWELLTYELRRGASQVTMKLSQGRDEKGHKLPEKPHTETNYNVNCKVRVKPLQDKVDRATIRAVFDGLEAKTLKSVEYKPGDLMLELGLYDAHLGKKANAEETGEVDYDLETAARDYKNTIKSLLSRVDRFNLSFDRILLPVGQDFFHIDNVNGTTTAGTYVDPDDRMTRIYRVGLECLVEAVESLRQLAPVDAIFVKGNHDASLSFFAAMTLAAHYSKTEGVSVDTGEQPRKYRGFGKCLIGFGHGAEEGKNIEKMMQVEAPELWGQTIYREFHLAHLHKEEVREEGGIIFRRISGMTPTDYWHAKKGYKGAQRKAQAFLWDREQGLEAVLNVGVD